ncbi:MAG TPA: hypothetical protein VHJ69_03410 [Gemmatimonadales bacterium]|jgi:hypothetical protein|nr:hypothetical protein [Gemmatimonadales bacterium]
MPRLYRNAVSLLLVPVLLVTVSCSTDETAFGPSRPELPTQLVASADGSGGSTLLEAAPLLACVEQPYTKVTKLVGPEGGSIVVGSHTLVIPKGALTEKVQISAEQVEGSVNSVRFSPEGLQFARAAEVRLSYSNCEQVPSKKQVVYTDEQLKVLELLPSRDSNSSRTVTGKIDHFSRYAVAY